MSIVISMEFRKPVGFQTELQRTFLTFLSLMKCLKPSWKKQIATLDSVLHINRTKGGEKLSVDVC